MSKLCILDKLIVITSTILVSLIGYGICFGASESRDYTQVTDHIYLEKGIDASEADLIQQYIDILPECIQQYFVGDGEGKVYVVSSLPSNIKGRTYPDTKEVYIVVGYEFDCLLHEFAHIYLADNPFDSSFEDIYNEESEGLINAYWGTASQYHYSNPTEYYCTAWNIVYMMQGNDELGVAPKTFEYFTNLFNEIY